LKPASLTHSFVDRSASRWPAATLSPVVTSDSYVAGNSPRRRYTLPTKGLKCQPQLRTAPELLFEEFHESQSSTPRVVSFAIFIRERFVGCDATRIDRYRLLRIPREPDTPAHAILCGLRCGHAEFISASSLLQSPELVSLDGRRRRFVRRGRGRGSCLPYPRWSAQLSVKRSPLGKGH
jgi:hypothetical protein